jgi:hypothetical protein
MGSWGAIDGALSTLVAEQESELRSALLVTLPAVVRLDNALRKWKGEVVAGRADQTSLFQLLDDLEDLHQRLGINRWIGLKHFLDI